MCYVAGGHAEKPVPSLCAQVSGCPVQKQEAEPCDRFVFAGLCQTVTHLMDTGLFLTSLS